MSERHEHPYIPRLQDELCEGRISRREFLRMATLLGVSASAAYGLLGLVDPGRGLAQTALPKGGRVRVGMRVHEIKDPHTISWVEASNILRQNCDYLTRTGNDNVTRPWSFFPASQFPRWCSDSTCSPMACGRSHSMTSMPVFRMKPVGKLELLR